MSGAFGVAALLYHHLLWFKVNSVLFGFANDGAAQVHVQAGRVEADSRPQPGGELSHIVCKLNVGQHAGGNLPACAHESCHAGEREDESGFPHDNNHPGSSSVLAQKLASGYSWRTFVTAESCMFCATICTRNRPVSRESRAVSGK
jgi:hypothetical protein